MYCLVCGTLNHDGRVIGNYHWCKVTKWVRCHTLHFATSLQMRRRNGHNAKVFNKVMKDLSK